MDDMKLGRPAFTETAPSLADAKPLYVLPADNLADDVLIPAFKSAMQARCMVGFFSSAVLADLAPGLAPYLLKAETCMRLVISPFLSEDDRNAMQAGLVGAEELAGQALRDALITKDALQQHTLRCLSWLLASGRLKVKIALLKNGLFHPKVWLFGLPQGLLAVHGSSNLTHSGLARNFEQVSLSRSWEDATQHYIADRLDRQFEALWDGKESECVTIDLPVALEQRMLREYRTEHPPTEEEFAVLYSKATQHSSEELPQVPTRSDMSRGFTIPTWLAIDDGPFAHQGQAVQSWVSAGFRGTLEMATGSGKTLTSMVCAHRLWQQRKPLLVVVSAPYVPLIEQWCGEIKLFGVTPFNLTTAGSAAGRARMIQRVRRNFQLKLSDVEVLVVSHDTLCTPDFAEAVRALDCSKLLIADEAHNLGRPQFLATPPDFIENRLALSATPVRQYDPDGSAAVFDFFGPVVFSFTLQEAIGRCLVGYDYFVHPVDLCASEFEEWNELTARIRENAWRQSDGKPDDFLSKLFRDRRALLEAAENKLPVLEALLDREDTRALRHTLIYTTDKAPEQLNRVNDLLRRRGILFHQLTAQETASRELTTRIIAAFQRGEIQVLTAKRVLDEGVNIPQICRAYILASTTVERQWIQRRGRLLRTCAEIGKTHSVIHDFLPLPADLNRTMDDDTRTLIKSELRRVQEFASLAQNAGRPDGPLEMIHSLVSASFMK